MNTYLRHRTARFRRWLGRSHSAAGLSLVAWLEQLRLDRREIRAFIHDPGDALIPTLALYIQYLQTDVCPGSSAIVMAPCRADARHFTHHVPHVKTFTLRRPDAPRGHSADQCLILRAHRARGGRRDTYLRARDALIPCASMAPGNLIIEHGDASRGGRSFRKMYARFHAEPDIFATYDATLPLELQNCATLRMAPAPDALHAAPLAGSTPLPPLPGAREDRRHLRYPAERPPDDAVMCYIERFRRGPSHSVSYMPEHVARLTCEDSVLYQEERRRECRRYYRLYHRPDPDRPLPVPGHPRARRPYPAKPRAKTRWAHPSTSRNAPYAHLGTAPYDPRHPITYRRPPAKQKRKKWPLATTRQKPTPAKIAIIAISAKKAKKAIAAKRPRAPGVTPAAVAPAA